ncbi:CD206 [Mytilus edulis]|uniref:MRC n=1 Tax=Mytilus edulis TaxID=6550 RepID=A0A8S3QFI1_MYTED|nr:CD206 [Mytilus edulis]
MLAQWQILHVTQTFHWLEENRYRAQHQAGMEIFHNVDKCNASGGQLTSIETGDENTFLVDVITLIMNIQRLRGYFWIGLTDNNDEMSYKWLSGEPLNYKNWYQGQPQQPDHLNYRGSTGAHCGMIHHDYSLNWGDERCSQNIDLISVSLREPYALSEDDMLCANLGVKYELSEDDMLFAFVIKY